MGSITGSNLMRFNDVKAEARRVLNIGKRLGVTFCGYDAEVIAKIRIDGTKWKLRLRK